MRIRFLVCAALGCTALLPAVASASHVQCGDTLTADTTLDSDVVCTTAGATGLVIGADNITVLTGDFTIQGPGTAVVPASIGIADDGTSHSGVTIRGHTTITGFDTGVDLDASSSSLQGLTVVGGSDGALMRGSDNYIYRVTADGVAFRGIEAVGDNLYLWGNIVLGTPQDGIIVDGESPLIVLNTVAACVFDGLLVSGYTEGKVVRNTVTGCDIGITPSGNGMLVQKNDTSQNCIGIFVDDPTALVRGNTANLNCSEGIVTGSAGAFLRNNTANDNADIGIDAVVGTIDGGGNTATGNGTMDCLGVIC
jgi:Periplasmic copper-binding protein (NosD)